MVVRLVPVAVVRRVVAVVVDHYRLVVEAVVRTAHATLREYPKS